MLACVGICQYSNEVMAFTPVLTIRDVCSGWGRNFNNLHSVQTLKPTMDMRGLA